MYLYHHFHLMMYRIKYNSSKLNVFFNKDFFDVDYF